MRKPKNDRVKPANTGLVSLLTEHIALFRALGFHVDVNNIGDPDRPSIEVVPGLIWAKADNETSRLSVVDELAKLLPEDVRRSFLRKIDRHYHAFFRMNGVSAWSRYDRTQRCTVPLGDDDTIIVRPASINCTTGENGESLLPIGVPVDSVVLWKYVGGRKVSGKALPFDLDAASGAGQFNRFEDPARLVTEVTLFPVINRRGRGGREVVEGQAFHTSGKRIICPLPVAWGEQGQYLLTERAEFFVAIPLIAVDTPEAGEAIAAAEEKPELGPDEYDCGAYRGNVWNDLAKFGVARDSSHGEIKKAHKKAVTERHPDATRIRLKSLPAEMIEDAVATAGIQFAPIQAAFERALEIRGAEWDAVEEALGDTTLEAVLGGEELKAFRARKDGEDLLTVAVATALGVPFDWKNGNHLGLRRKAITDLAKAAKVEEPPEEPAPAPAAPAEAPAPQ